MEIKKVLFLIVFVFIVIGNVISMNNYIVFQKSNGDIFFLDLSINKVEQIATGQSEITGFVIQKNSLVLFTKNNINVTITDIALRGLFENPKPQNSIKAYEVKTDGNSISLFANGILKWRKIHASKGFYAKHEGYCNAAVSKEYQKIISERNWLGFWGVFNPSKFLNKTIVEIDINTKNENLICKNCSYPSYSANGEYILYKKTDTQKYCVIEVENGKKIELECVNAFWIY